MRSCSDSIAQLAAALAKAQMELVNPVKSLTAVIDRWGTGNEGQSYRYAPLSAGLEIVRKTLCKHELAVIQTTHVDAKGAMVLLTTTLAHGSGEWVAASWPVCRTADMTNPKLMGAALTYARRYGLFTLVGIAGEDDLDAPDLPSARLNEGLPEEPFSSKAKPNGEARNEPYPPDAREEPHGSDALVKTQSSDHEAARQAANPGDSVEEPHLGVRGREPESGPEAVAGFKHTRRRGRGSLRVTPGERLRAILSDNPLRDLGEVEDSDGLFRWALAVLPIRNKLPDAAREALDSAFLAKADLLRIGAET
jgi:hypothetical protein